MATADIDLTARPFSNDPSAPDPVPPHAGEGAAPTGDPLDDLLDTDRTIDNVYRDAVTNDTTGPANGNTIDLNDGNGEDDVSAEEGGLGIDEEVKVRKPRAPVAKLDETRLLSERGIPRLRSWKVGKERCRFKGKGHEFSDISRLLSTYQLWLDDLFPKAKFGDGLAIIEKLGHSRRMQLMRREWIDEDKPKPIDIDPSDDDQPMPDRDAVAAHDEGGREGAENSREDEALFVPDERPARFETPMQEDVDRDFEERYAMPSPGAVPAPNHKAAHGDATGGGDQRAAPAPAQGGRTEAAVEGPEEDELDQLLAEDAARDASAGVSGNAQATTAGNDEFAEDEEAMREMGVDW
ncbi:MAG: chromosome segregation in meiosis- protein [Alyxoria varia]|nr:MAG: chromosome segregation in meiosis- protein [Alyxoria varia]